MGGFCYGLLGFFYGLSNPSEWKKAEKYILEGKRLVDELWALSLSTHANLFAVEMLLEVGQTERAKEYLIQAESSFRKMTCDYWADKAKELLDRLL